MYFYRFFYIDVKKILPYYLYFCPISLEFCTTDVNGTLLGNLEFRGNQHGGLKKYLSVLSTLIFLFMQNSIEEFCT